LAEVSPVSARAFRTVVNERLSEWGEPPLPGQHVPHSEITWQDLPWIAEAIGYPDAELWHMTEGLALRAREFSEARAANTDWATIPFDDRTALPPKVVMAFGGRDFDPVAFLYSLRLDDLFEAGIFEVDVEARRVSGLSPRGLTFYRAAAAKRSFNGPGAIGTLAAFEIEAVIAFATSQRLLRQTGAEAVLRCSRTGSSPREVASIRWRKIANEGPGDIEPAGDYVDPRGYRYRVPAYLRRKYAPDGPLIQVREHVNGPKGKPFRAVLRVNQVTR
jgi:hypothetical protein